MRVLMVFFIFLVVTSCTKDDCYRCTQHIRIYTNKIKVGYPKSYKTKFFSCGENVESIDNPFPIVYNDTIGDTIYTYWKDTDCTK